MEGDLKNKETYHPQLLDLIHKEKEWILREKDEKNFKLVSEEKKLELRLGPPGEDYFNHENNNRNRNNSNWLVNNHKVLGSPWISAPSTTSSSPSAFQMKNQQQHHVKQSYLQFQSIPQNLSTIMESSQACSTKAATGELQQSHPEKNASSPSPASVPANPSVNNSSQKRTAPSPVVGWPPIRSFRKNLASSSSHSKSASDPQTEIRTTKESSSRKPDAGNKGMFVKINMDGVPIGRKVDLKAYDSYEKLSCAVDELFRVLLAAQRDSPAPGNHNKMAEVEEITGLLDGSGEYTLVYEDNEGDRMLVGDVPWDMFVSTVKRLRVLKSSELSALHLGSSRQERAPVDSAVK